LGLPLTHGRESQLAGLDERRLESVATPQEPSGNPLVPPRKPRNLSHVTSAEPQPTQRAEDPWRLNEIVRRRRLREQGRRTLGQNLEEGLALSKFLSSFRGAARR
jgi:hypothetical protein